jgi:hypothetical protein
LKGSTSRPGDRAQRQRVHGEVAAAQVLLDRDRRVRHHGEVAVAGAGRALGARQRHVHVSSAQVTFKHAEGLAHGVHLAGQDLEQPLDVEPVHEQVAVLGLQARKESRTQPPTKYGRPPAATTASVMTRVVRV